jgi:hypothetical protein
MLAALRGLCCRRLGRVMTVTPPRLSAPVSWGLSGVRLVDLVASHPFSRRHNRL